LPNINGVAVSEVPDVSLDPDLNPVCSRTFRPGRNVRKANDNTDTYGQEQSPDLQPGDELL
jgi:hypothetical protein